MRGVIGFDKPPPPPPPPPPPRQSEVTFTIEFFKSILSRTKVYRMKHVCYCINQIQPPPPPPPPPPIPEGCVRPCICVSWSYKYVSIGPTSMCPLVLHVCVHWSYMYVSIGPTCMCPLVLHHWSYMYVSIGPICMCPLVLTHSVLNSPAISGPVRSF